MLITVYDLSRTFSRSRRSSRRTASRRKLTLACAAGNLKSAAGGTCGDLSSPPSRWSATDGGRKLDAENWRQLSDAILGAAGPIKQALLDAGAVHGRDFAAGHVRRSDFAIIQRRAQELRPNRRGGGGHVNGDSARGAIQTRSPAGS